MGEEGFRWFLGVVEDNVDPRKLGRVKVRVLHEQSEEITTADMEWAHVMLPNTSGSLGGVGDTPMLEIGSNVIGFFLDSREKQLPMILGSYPIIPDLNDDKHSLSYLARGKQTLDKSRIGPEPASPYKAEYPNNRVIHTRSGHAIELDDTPEHERIHIYHKSGTYIEINSEGRIVIKSVEDSLDIVGGVKTIYAEGNINVASQENVKIEAARGIVMSAPGGVTVTEGSLLVKGAISTATGVSGTFTTPTGKTVEVINGIVTNIV